MSAYDVKLQYQSGLTCSYEAAGQGPQEVMIAAAKSATDDIFSITVTPNDWFYWKDDDDESEVTPN